ncbi:hypothetical protein DO97_16295 [Neosynechococcus sphagnicola sy1]|uniref:Uncharacterized protein n=2 Tax=Neosynechococcus TaxID=1501143 RepID=A0A098TI29_9CYAN|nr:hypothetical protein DO97_16295 [Neosynechococcus sphagnicola sy1]
MRLGTLTRQKLLIFSLLFTLTLTLVSVFEYFPPLTNAATTPLRSPPPSQLKGHKSLMPREPQSS